MKFTEENILNPLLFKDEPHFQYEMLHRNIPIKHKGEIYYPLVSEFPASPGIDMIFFSNTGKMILAELKYDSDKFEFAQKETVHHFVKYKNNKISDIVAYAHSNKLERNEKKILEFEERFQQKMKNTLRELHEAGSIELIALFYGYEPKHLNLICSDVVFVLFDMRVVRVKSFLYTGERVSLETVFKEYEQDIKELQA